MIMHNKLDKIKNLESSPKVIKKRAGANPCLKLIKKLSD